MFEYLQIISLRAGSSISMEGNSKKRFLFYVKRVKTFVDVDEKKKTNEVASCFKEKSKKMKTERLGKNGQWEH